MCPSLTRRTRLELQALPRRAVGKNDSPMKVLIRAFLLGWGVMIATVLPWSALAGLNLRVSPQIPWSVVVTAVYLTVLLSYLNGRGWPASTQSARRQLLRARWLSVREWSWALAAGLSGVVALWLVYAAIGGFTHSATSSGPANSLSTPVLLLAITMGAAVTATGEEGGFRGYMQATLESRFAPGTAILIAGIAFALAHLSHGAADVARNGLFYLAVSFIYGFQAYLTKSILPSLVLHFAGDVFVFSLRSGLVLLNMPTGAGTTISLMAGAIVLALASAIAFVRLARVAASDRNVDLSPTGTERISTR
jgi:membrane protease YdiL (CAAX protease family)